MRKNTRAVRIGGVTVGGGNPVAVQSMLNVPIHDIAGNVAQAKRLEAEGCQIVRVTVPSVADVPVVEALKNAVKMPVVADIHFDYKVALACAEAGVDKIRINPGNIGDDAHVGEVASACAARLSAGAASALRLAVRMLGVSSRLMGPTLSRRATKALLAAA